MTREQKSWNDLAAEAYSGHTSQGAVVEALRRVCAALEANDRSATALGQRIENLNWWLLYYTVAMAVLAAFQFGGLIHDWVHPR